MFNWGNRTKKEDRPIAESQDKAVLLAEIAKRDRLLELARKQMDKTKLELGDTLRKINEDFDLNKGKKI